MANVADSGRKSFTFIWKIENANYSQWAEDLESPVFNVDEVDKTNWQLELRFFSRDCDSELSLRRRDSGAGNVEIDCELACLGSNGAVLYSVERKNSVIGFNEYISDDGFPSLNEVFFEKREVFLSQNALTVRCRIRKSVGEISKADQWFARTRIVVEKRSFQWNIEKFSSLEWEDKETYKITSLETCEQLMVLELSLTRGQIYDPAIHLKIIPNYKSITMAALKISVVDASKNIVKCFQCELWKDIPTDSKDFTLFQSQIDLIKNKREFLPHDVLSLLCECSFSFGKVANEFEGASTNCFGIENLEPNMVKANELPVPKGVLINDLKTILNNSVLSDVKLKTRSKTYPAHKVILGARSPVFKAMFSNDMKENTNAYVDIDDLNDETVLQMLQYIYCADVEELDWGRATELYEAADKYEILNLKDLCASYLKSNLCPSNACEALVLADLHQDQDLKIFVQDFVLRHGKNVINSEEWNKLMETNLQLAADTMRRKYKELAK